MTGIMNGWTYRHRAARQWFQLTHSRPKLYVFMSRPRSWSPFFLAYTIDRRIRGERAD